MISFRTFLFAVLYVLALSAICWAAEAAEVAKAAESPIGAMIAADVMSWLPASWEGWITSVVTICAAISAVWPRPDEDANVFWRLLYTIVNAIGFNVGKAKNADDDRY